MRRLLPLLLLSGCSAQFTPETVVNSLRVLSLVAEPPEVRPGETSRLEVEWGDPSRINEPSTAIWVGCDPDPLDLGRSACNDATMLIEPTRIEQLPEGMRLLGLGQDIVSYTPSASSFDVLPADDARRQTGSVGLVIVIVIGEDVGSQLEGEGLKEMLQRVQDRSTPAAIAVSRVLVSEKTSGRNQNPVIDGLTFDGQVLPRGAKLQVRAGQEVQLGAAIPASSRETYVEQLPSGPVERTETVVGAWYSIGGRFSRERFEVGDDSATTFYAPGHPDFPDDVVPERRLGELWLVARDNRGAQAYRTFRYWVCDEAAPRPEVASLTPPASETEVAVVRGAGMAGVLDVLVGDVAMTNATYSAARDAYVGDLPALPAGTYPVSVRGKNCENFDTGLTYTVP